MKRFNRFAGLAMASVMMFSMAACTKTGGTGAGDGNTTAKESSNVTESTTIAESTTVTETSESTAAADVTIDENNFPDKIFREFIKKKADKDGDGILSKQEIEDCQMIMSSDDGQQHGILIGKGVTSLKGIEFFTNLKRLDISEDNLTELDLSHNEELEYLQLYRTKLTSLDLSHNRKLQKLWLTYGEMTQIDLSTNTELKDLSISFVPINEIDLNNNKKLQRLEISVTNLEKIDLSKAPELQTLFLETDKLTALDVSHNPLLVYARITCNKIKSLDVSSCPELNNVVKKGKKTKGGNEWEIKKDNMTYRYLLVDSECKVITK